MRTIGGWLWTAATVAIRFWLAFSPLPLRTTRSARSGLTIGMRLQSIAPSRTICSAERFGTVAPVISATSVIASSNGPHTTALMSRRWHS